MVQAHLGDVVEEQPEVACVICGRALPIPLNLGSICVVCNSCGTHYFVDPIEQGPGAHGQEHTEGGVFKIGNVTIEYILPRSLGNEMAYRGTVIRKTGSSTRILKFGDRMGRTPQPVCSAPWEWHLHPRFNSLSRPSSAQIQMIPCITCAVNAGLSTPANIMSGASTVLISNMGPLGIVCNCGSLFLVNPLRWGPATVGGVHFNFADNSAMGFESTAPSMFDHPLELIREMLIIKVGSPLRLFSFARTDTGSELVCRAPWHWHLMEGGDR